MTYTGFIYKFIPHTLFTERQENKLEVKERLDKNISQSAHRITDTLQLKSNIKTLIKQTYFCKGCELLSLA
jgi:hypothetical protein